MTPLASRSTAPSPPPTSDKIGSIGLLLLVAGLLVGAAVALGFIANEWAQLLILGLLVLLSIVGVFSLFALAVGQLRFGGTTTTDPFAKDIVDSSEQGVLVTEPGGRILYANRAYLDMSRAGGVTDARPVERLFSGAPEVSEAVYRLAMAGRESRVLTEDVRLQAKLSGEQQAGWYQIRVSPLPRSAKSGQSAIVWRIAEVTDERRDQEKVFQELQHAIDFLDHAPCGFLSVDQGGDVPYLNATLANWLGHDLARVGSGGLSLSDIASANTVALIRAIRGEPGDVRTEVLDVDLKRRDGSLLPVKVHHEVAFGADGVAGPSRTLVLDQSAAGVGADAGSAAEVRLARFFHSAPIGIATLDADGQIKRGNATFLKLTSAKSLAAMLAEGQATGEVFAAALAGKPDLAPVDVMLAGEGGRSARLYLSPATDGAEGGERVTLYALDTTAERKLKDNIDQAAEDERGGATRRRYRARLQQRAAGDHQRIGVPAGQPQADGSVLLRHHADQAERLSRGLAGQATPGVLAPPDAAPAGAGNGRCALRPATDAEARRR